MDKLVAGAVKQVQRGIGKAADFLDFIPGLSAVAGLAQYFVELSLGYVDECCLGYTFYQEDESAFKSAADGVVIYAQNWKSSSPGPRSPSSAAAAARRTNAERSFAGAAGRICGCDEQLWILCCLTLYLCV